MLELLEEEHGKEEATIASIKEADEARMLSVTFCRLLLGGGVVVVGAMSSSFEILSEEGFAFEGSE